MNSYALGQGMPLRRQEEMQARQHGYFVASQPSPPGNAVTIDWDRYYLSTGRTDLRDAFVQGQRIYWEQQARQRQNATSPGGR